MPSNKQIATGCKHFSGLVNDECRAGVAYKTLQMPFPCLHQKDHTFSGTCLLFEFYTEAEIDERERQAVESARRWTETLAAGICPWCGGSTEPRHKTGRCVYGACGCRLYQEGE